MVLYRKERYVISGACLAYAAAMRGFPALLALYPVLQVTLQAVRLRRPERRHLVFLGSALASGLLIVPDLLPRFFGPGPHLVGAPCRDVVMAFAEDTSLDLVFDLVESLAWADPVGLIPTCYRHVGGVLEPITAPPGPIVLPEVDPPVRQRFVS